MSPGVTILECVLVQSGAIRRDFSKIVHCRIASVGEQLEFVGGKLIRDC